MIAIQSWARISGNVTAVIMTAVLLMPHATNATEGETTLGRWCDRMIPGTPKYNRTMAIVITNDGKIVLKSRFGDGSSSANELEESSGGIYLQIGSRFGDKYRVVPSTGELQLLDNDGLIRVAFRLENAPQRNECSR